MTIDHKPLLAIFGNDQNLEEIENPRLLNFKLKSLMFRFTVLHVPRKKNITADAFSRRYDSPVTKPQPITQTLESAPVPGYSSTLGPPPWVSPPVLIASTHVETTPTLETVKQISTSLAQLYAAPASCEEQMAPEHVLVLYIMLCIA